MFTPVVSGIKCSWGEKIPPMPKRGRPPQRRPSSYPNRILALREARGLTQEQLAEKVGMSFQNVGKIERGEIRLYTEYLKRFATALECHPAEILPDALALSPQESALLALFSRMPPQARDQLLRIGATFSEPAPERPADERPGAPPTGARRKKS